MNSLYKISLIIISTVVITAISTYYLFSNQTESSSQESVTFEQKQECQRIGERYYEKDLVDAEETTIFDQYSIGTPTFGYSPKLNTCAYINSGLSYVEQIDEYRERKYIVDLMTNEDIEHSVYATKKGEYVEKHSHGLTSEQFESFVSGLLN